MALRDRQILAMFVREKHVLTVTRIPPDLRVIPDMLRRPAIGILPFELPTRTGAPAPFPTAVRPPAALLALPPRLGGRNRLPRQNPRSMKFPCRSAG